MLNFYPTLPTYKSRLFGRIDRSLISGLSKIIRRLDPKTKPHVVNSGAWCIHGPIKTRIVFFNYFWRNYHEENVGLDVQLFDGKGSQLWQTKILVSQDQTIVIDTALISAEIGRDNFEGYFVLSLSSGKLPPTRADLRYNVDYYTDGGFLSTVHDQAIFDPSFPPIFHSLGKMEVVETDQVTSALIFVNSLQFEGVPVTVTVKVHRHDGNAMQIGTYRMPTRSMLRIELGKEQPALQGFLEGRSGQVVCESDHYIRRAAVVHYSKLKMSDWFSVNHSEEYRGARPYDKRTLSTAARVDRSGPVAPLPFFHNCEGIGTDFVIFHDVTEIAEQAYGISLFDSGGHLLFKNDSLVKVPLHGTARIRVADLLGSEKSVFGLAQICSAAAPHNSSWVDSFPADAHYYFAREAGWDAMYSQGSYNSLNAERIDRTRVFSRIYFDAKFQTELFLFFGSSASQQGDGPGCRESRTQITLCSPDGDVAVTKEIRLKPFETNRVILPDLFPEISGFNLKPGRPCAVYVRDSVAKIIVVHVTRDSSKRTIAVDHFYGG